MSLDRTIKYLHKILDRFSLIKIPRKLLFYARKNVREEGLTNWEMYSSHLSLKLFIKCLYNFNESWHTFVALRPGALKILVQILNKKKYKQMFS